MRASDAEPDNDIIVPGKSILDDLLTKIRKNRPLRASMTNMDCSSPAAIRCVSVHFEAVNRREVSSECTWGHVRAAFLTDSLLPHPKLVKGATFRTSSMPVLPTTACCEIEPARAHSVSHARRGIAFNSAASSERVIVLVQASQAEIS